MDAGSIFLICFAVVFGSLLIGGWRFGYSLLVCWERRRSRRDRMSQDRRRENGRVQDGQESAKASQEAQGLDVVSRKDLVYRLSAPSTSDKQPTPSPPSRPIGRLSSTLSQPISSDGSYRSTTSDLINDPHDLQNMTTVPPVPSKCPSRPVAGIGTQAPPAALLARRSQDTMVSKRSALSGTSRSSSRCGEADGSRVVTATSPALKRTRTASDTGTQSPLRQVSRPESPIDPVPPIPAYLNNSAQTEESQKASPPKAQPLAKDISNNSEYLITNGKLNQQQIEAAKVKVSAANAAIKTPRKHQQAGSTDYYEVKGLLSMSPSLRKPTTPEIDTFHAPPPQPCLNDKSRGARISFSDSLKRLTSRIKAMPTDEEATPPQKCNISGPSSYVPHIGSGWSPNEYLTLHNANPIENPLIEHPAICLTQFGKPHNSFDEDQEDSTPLMVSHKLRQLDRQHGYKTPCKVSGSRSSTDDIGRNSCD